MCSRRRQDRTTRWWVTALIVLLAQPVSPSLGLRAEANPDLKITPNRHKFAAQVFGVIGATSPARTIHVRNRGQNAIIIDSIQIGGTNPLDFAITSDSCPIGGSGLAAGAKCRIILTFTPTGLGPRSATLTITSSAPSSPQSVDLNRTGKRGKLIRRPARLSFGKVPAGSTGPPLTVALVNKNPVPLAITAITAPTGFAASQNCVGNLPGNGENCSISVPFKPPGESYPKATRITGALIITAGARPVQQKVLLSGIAFGTVPPQPPPPFSTAQTIVTNSCAFATSYPAGAVGDLVPLSLPTGMCGPVGVGLDSRGNIYVANSNNSITIYAAGASGNASPVGIIAGPNTGLHDPVGIAVEKSGNIYVANRAAGYDYPLDSITVYAAGLFGNVAPPSSIEGSNTSLASGLRSITVATPATFTPAKIPDTWTFLLLAAAAT